VEPVRTEIEDDVAVLSLDDGKANALSPPVIEALQAGLDRAEKDAGAVLLLGREGRFCAGFDLSVMRGGAGAARDLVAAGAELFLRLYELPLPVVIGCSGHALAAGGVALLSADIRLGARGGFRIGLNEVAIGMTLPLFALELARARLSKRHFDRAVVHAELYDPETAVDAGFLDRIVDAEDLGEEARAEATRLASLPRAAFRNTKGRAHAGTVGLIRKTLEEDLAALLGG
jgi:enoyl-CoA hydratase